MDFIGLVIARYGSASLTDNPAAFDPTAPTQGAEVLVPILHDVSAALAVLRDAPGGIDFLVDNLHGVAAVIETFNSLAVPTAREAEADAQAAHNDPSAFPYTLG